MSIKAFPIRIQKVCMPYDARINDASCCPGTMSDFAQRAAHHFVKYIWSISSQQTAEYHANEVIRLLSKLIKPVIPKRKQVGDDEVRNIITMNWERAQGISNRMHRVLRDELLIACEQKRFSQLFNQVKEGMI